MPSTSLRAVGLLASFTLCAAAGCDDDDDGHPHAGGQAGESLSGAGGETSLAGQGGESAGAGGAHDELEKLTIQFRATVGDADFKCGESYEQQGTTRTTVVPQDLRFFVENVRLIDAEDNEAPLVMDDRPPFQSAAVALLDFEDGTGACANGNAELNATITGKVRPGSYVGIAFSTAVPTDLNHSDPTTLPAPLQAGGMTWGWLFGFRFIKAELVVPTHHGGEGGAGGRQGHGGQGHDIVEGGAGQGGAPPVDGHGSGHGPQSPGGVFHLGSIECENAAEPDHNAPPATACAKSFRNDIRLKSFNPHESVIVADVGALFAGVDLASDSQCHSFAGSVCPALFETVGLDYATGDIIDGQTFFRIE
jgi:hypothetical protein